MLYTFAHMGNWVSVSLTIFLFVNLPPIASVVDRAEYWLSILKVVTIVIFIILGIAVNAGGNTTHHYTASETRNPTRTIPRVVKLVFFRLVFYLCFSLMIPQLNIHFVADHSFRGNPEFSYFIH